MAWYLCEMMILVFFNYDIINIGFLRSELILTFFNGQIDLNLEVCISNIMSTGQ
jgi:hypothetical protein